MVEDTQLPSGKRFVLKELTPIEHDPQTYDLVKQRFEREAVILEELGGLTTQIPSLYAYFTEAGKFYLVQEYVEGETIAQKVIAQGVMSDAAVRDWLGGILPVLSLVHDRQIIHRDIKPENIILQRQDQKPVLIDFGAVRESMGLKLTPQGQSTQSIVIGTPGYMPSEQAAGRAVFASDLYAVGLTAIYALTGKIPQELPTDPMTGEVQWRSYALTVSTGLAEILDRAIASHSRDRFATAQEMMMALGYGFVSGTIPKTVLSGTSSPMKPQVLSSSPQPTVVAALDHSPVDSQLNSSNQQSSNDPKTLLLAIGVGALVTLSGIGIFSLLTNKDSSAPTVQNSPSPSIVASSSPSPKNLKPIETPSPIVSSTPPQVEPSALATPTVKPSSLPTESWQRLGMAVTGEEVAVDSGSIQKSGRNLNFIYKIGDEVISANADCSGNRWFANGYGWQSPKSEATIKMLNYVCGRG